MGHQLGVVLVIQGDAGQRPRDGGRVARVHLLEDDYREMRTRVKPGVEGREGGRGGGGGGGVRMSMGLWGFQSN